jgi:glycosyltransferase involved in cell wall biosynthesis
MGRHWTINGRFFSQPVTGVQRYAREIVAALDSLIAEQPPASRDLEVELLLPPGTDAPLALSSITCRVVGKVTGHAWEQAVLPANARGGVLSLCNTGPVLSRSHIVCLHDANILNAPQSYSLAFRSLYRVLMPALGQSAQMVATVSGFSRSEIVRHHIAEAQKIFVAPNGHEHALRWRPRHSTETHEAASRNTVVMIGSSAPHKNLSLVLDMCERLDNVGLTVAVVGMSDPRVFKSGQAQIAAANIHWLGRISDEQLAALLRDSMCLAFPSLTEGFGLPVLEAMAIGCPVVVADRASLPEVCHDAALYASPTNPDTWFSHFMHLKQSEAQRLQMMAKGRARAARFSWRRSAMSYLTAMAELDGVKTNGDFSEPIHELS